MKQLAMIFPGQGSQQVGMLAKLAEQFPIIKATIDEASDAMHYSMWSLMQHGPEQKLNQTEFTQPALLTASIAIWRLWQQQKGIKPMLMAGHSLGEYSALVAADALDFAEALDLVAARGRFMQMSVPPHLGKSAMAACIGLDNDTIIEICKQVANDEVLEPANYNAIGQTVVAGLETAVERFVPAAKAAGAKIVKVLPVSVASHCELMDLAAEQLGEVLENTNIRAPKIAVIHNADVKTHTHSDEIKQALVTQLTAPVRWVETIQRMVAEGMNYCVECGPGNVLTGLNKRIERTLITQALATPEGLQQALSDAQTSEV